MYRQAVLFEGVDTSAHFNLWVTNGTVAGTHELTGIGGANSGGLFRNLAGRAPLTALGDRRDGRRHV